MTGAKSKRVNHTVAAGADEEPRRCGQEEAVAGKPQVLLAWEYRKAGCLATVRKEALHGEGCFTFPPKVQKVHKCRMGL